MADQMSEEELLQLAIALSLEQESAQTEGAQAVASTSGGSKRNHDASGPSDDEESTSRVARQRVDEARRFVLMHAILLVT